MTFVTRSLTIAALLAAATSAAAQDAPAAPKKLPTFAASDADKDGSLNKAEWDASGRIPQRFAKVDANSDGKVTSEELTIANQAVIDQRRAAAAARPSQ